MEIEKTVQADLETQRRIVSAGPNFEKKILYTSAGHRSLRLRFFISTRVTRRLPWSCCLYRPVRGSAPYVVIVGRTPSISAPRIGWIVRGGLAEGNGV